MSGGLAQKASHAMVQGTAWEGHKEISSCIMQGCNGDKTIDGQRASDREDETPAMAYGARNIKELGRNPTGVTVAMVGTAQEEVCDGLCRQYDEAQQINAVCAHYPPLAACRGNATEKHQFAGGRTLAPILKRRTKAKDEHIRQDVHATPSPEVRLHRDKNIHSCAVADLAYKPDATGIASGVKNLRSGNAHNNFRPHPSDAPGSASSLVASVGERSHASSIILTRLGIPSANSAERARMNKKSPCYIPEHCRPAPQTGFLPFFWRVPQEQDTPAPQPRLIRRTQQQLLGLRRNAIRWRGQARPWSLRLEAETSIYEDALRRAALDRCTLATKKQSYATA